MKIYTLPEVAKMLSVSVETVRRYLKSGKLKGSKIGKAWRVTEEQIKEFLESTTKD